MRVDDLNTILFTGLIILFVSLVVVWCFFKCIEVGDNELMLIETLVQNEELCQSVMIDRVPSYQDLPSPFLRGHKRRVSLENDPMTPPPVYNNWFRDEVFKAAMNK